MLRKFKHVTAVTALLAASSSAVTIEKQPQAPTEIDLNQIDIADMVDTNNLELRESAEVEQSYGDAPKTVETMLETMKDIVFTFKDENTVRAVQELAQISGVMEILVNYLTTNPSKQEKSILKQLKKVTDVMVKNQQMTASVLKAMPKNTHFLQKEDKDLQLLDKMVASQLARGNMYRDNSIVFHCGENAHVCKIAYQRWVNTMQNRMTKLMKDGKANAKGKHADLGYNIETLGNAFAYQMMQLQRFSTGILLADAGARAWDNRQEDPNPKSPIPSITLQQQQYADFVSQLEENNFNWMQDQMPYFMHYTKTSNPAMGYGDKPREGRNSLFVKGFHIGNGKYTNNIDGMIWGEASRGYTHTETVDCATKLGKPNGMCECPHNTWMRGQSFPAAKKNRYLNGWTKNYCNHFNGYTHKNCEVVDFKGTNAWTNCPMKKYVVGIGRGADKQGGMDKAKFKCCELEYNHYYSGLRKIPEKYYAANKKSVGFRTSDKKKYFTSSGKYAYQNKGTHEAKAQIKLVQADKNEVNNGFFRLQTNTGGYVGCFEKTSDLKTNLKANNPNQIRFTIVDHDKDVVLYHPTTAKFVTLNAKTGRFECQQTSIDKASHFQGPKMPFPDINEHLYYPELFRTALTADNEKKGSGWGFQPSAVSEWFSLYNKKKGVWLKANNDHKLITLKNKRPGPWEKFKLERFEKGGHVVWGIKSFHGRYLVCESNKGANINRTWHRAWEEMKLFQVETGKFVIYSQYWGRYLRIVGNDVKCDTENPNKATHFTSPVAL